jgi:hypothetical protein
MRLRGRRRENLTELRASERWRAARATIDGLLAPPKLELEG